MNDQEYIKRQMLKFIEWMNDEENGETVSFKDRKVSETKAFFQELYSGRNNGVLNCYNHYAKEIETYSKICKNKIFPVTDHKNLETNFFTDEYIPSLDTDPETASENIHQAYEELIHDKGFTLLNFNSTAVIGLFHLFEKGCRSMIESELSSCWFNGSKLIDEKNRKLKISEIDKNYDRWDLWLKILLDIDIFKDFPNLKKLKSSANYLKHGRGYSKERLKKEFPKLFKEGDKLLMCHPLSESLGDLIYLNFDELVGECLGFWKSLENYGSKQTKQVNPSF